MKNMINLKDIDASIEYYENQPTSLETCRILADLYVCRDNANCEKVYDMPLISSYNKYVRTKRTYQLYNTDKEILLSDMSELSTEISNLISLLLQNSETEQERDILKTEITNVLETL